MKTWTRDEDLTGHQTCHCRSCGRVIVDVPDVGWVDPGPGGAYDLCAGDSLGNHQPDLRHLRSFGEKVPTDAEDTADIVPSRGGPSSLPESPTAART
jgi:hypothetical protein